MKRERGREGGEGERRACVCNKIIMRHEHIDEALQCIMDVVLVIWSKTESNHKQWKN